jgi:hypothetical protein
MQIKAVTMNAAEEIERLLDLNRKSETILEASKEAVATTGEAMSCPHFGVGQQRGNSNAKQKRGRLPSKKQDQEQEVMMASRAFCGGQTRSGASPLCCAMDGNWWRPIGWCSGCTTR